LFQIYFVFFSSSSTTANIFYSHEFYFCYNFYLGYPMGESIKNLENPYKYPWKLEEKTKEKRERKTWGDTLLIDPIVKVQEPNIEGLTSFKKKSKRERRKEKRRKNNSLYSQQAWRRYNDVTTQGWSPCGLLIHAFLIFEPLLIFFESWFSVMMFSSFILINT